MNSQISAETLQPTLHDGVKVITTELLAQLYGTEALNIQVNHTRNRARFIEGKHFFKLEGAELKEFKNRLTQSKSVDDRLSLSQSVGKRARSLILWTERGAARHAKMLETDQAWEVFEKLEDFYFTKGEAARERGQEKVKSSKSLPKRQKPSRPSPHKHYIACLTIQDEVTGGIVELNLRAECMQSLATGLATCLGYRPIGFHSVPIKKDAFEKIA
ncbi:TPA: ORF6N domain-containing protein [Serratia marcescens]